MRKSVLAVVAAVSMVGLGSGALAQSAAPLSVAANAPADARAGADAEDASNYRGGFILPTLVVLAIIAAIYVLTKDDGPSSP